jgi:chromosome partitioning protein
VAGEGDNLPSDLQTSGLGWPGLGLEAGPVLDLSHLSPSTESGLQSDGMSGGKAGLEPAVDQAETTVVGQLEATGPDVSPVTDDVSRETASRGGLVEHLSERDQVAASLPDPGSETPLARAVALDARRRVSLVGKIFPKPDHTRVLTVANQKGGVGKTTTTVNIAAGLAQAGLRVLVVDIDPQGNASTALGIDHHAEVPSVYDVLVDGTPVADVVQECVDIPNLWCIPATIDLAGAEIELVSLVARETRMEKALTAYLKGAEDRGEERMDYVLIDCPPSLGLLTVNAFVAADEVLIPIQCEYYALEGLSQLLKNIELIKSHLNPGLHVSTILLTMYDGRTRLSAQVAEEVRAHFPEQVLRTSVPRSVRISEAPSFGQTVMTYDPNSSGALSYLEAAGELADRGTSR